jgi:AraC-like DNA-binding protein
MIIPNETLKKWSELKQTGDIALIAQELGKSEPTVYKIFSSGEAHVRDAKLINEFFKRRKKEIAAIKISDDGN